MASCDSVIYKLKECVKRYYNVVGGNPNLDELKKCLLFKLSKEKGSIRLCIQSYIAAVEGDCFGPLYIDVKYCACETTYRIKLVARYLEGAVYFSELKCDEENPFDNDEWIPAGRIVLSVDNMDKCKDKCKDKKRRRRSKRRRKHSKSRSCSSSSSSSSSSCDDVEYCKPKHKPDKHKEKYGKIQFVKEVKCSKYKPCDRKKLCEPYKPNNYQTPLLTLLTLIGNASQSRCRKRCDDFKGANIIYKKAKCDDDYKSCGGVKLRDIKVRVYQGSVLDEKLHLNSCGRSAGGKYAQLVDVADALGFTICKPLARWLEAFFWVCCGSYNYLVAHPEFPLLVYSLWCDNVPDCWEDYIKYHFKKDSIAQVTKYYISLPALYVNIFE